MKIKSMKMQSIFKAFEIKRISKLSSIRNLKISKKSQMEIMGLVIIIILISDEPKGDSTELVAGSTPINGIFRQPLQESFDLQFFS